MTQVEIVKGLKSGGAAVLSQAVQNWGRTPNASAGQRSAELELIASDCCQCNTNPRSTKSAF